MLSSFQPARLTCGIGHEQTGQIRRVQYVTYDMDGDPLVQSAEDEYEPSRCVVCGLVIWSGKAVESLRKS